MLLDYGHDSDFVGRVSVGCAMWQHIVKLNVDDGGLSKAVRDYLESRNEVVKIEEIDVMVCSVRPE